MWYGQALALRETSPSDPSRCMSCMGVQPFHSFLSVQVPQQQRPLQLHLNLCVRHVGIAATASTSGEPRGGVRRPCMPILPSRPQSLPRSPGLPSNSPMSPCWGLALLGRTLPLPSPLHCRTRCLPCLCLALAGGVAVFLCEPRCLLRYRVVSMSGSAWPFPLGCTSHEWRFDG